METHSLGGVSSIFALLRYRADHQADRIGYQFLAYGQELQRSMTYMELDLRARTVAAMLQDHGAVNERVLLLYPPGLEYIAAFFGCLYAGAVPVPCYPVKQHKPDLRVLSAARDSQAAFALSLAKDIPGEAWRQEHLPHIRWLSSEQLEDSAASSWHEPSIQQDSLAYLQYTSGSTADPKGVMVTHSNLLHNLELIRNSFKHTSESKGVIWLPPYHDMGLIGGILQPLYSGFPVILMSPLSFMEQPARWLQAISAHKATTSGGPNFAYDLCVRKISDEQIQNLDLSSWELAFNGSEMIREESLHRFVSKFSNYGFRKESFYACYGLAEGTLIVSSGSKEAVPEVQKLSSAALEQQTAAAASEDEEFRTLVSCGQSPSDQSVRIVDPVTHIPCRNGQVGEIWVAGPSIAAGYWNRPEETAAVFHAYIAGLEEGTSGPFLRTGDLGCLLDQQLYITGRLKDLVVVRGKNHYSQDIEYTVEQCHPAIMEGAGAAFSVEAEDGEHLVIVQELKREYRKADLEAVGKVVRDAVANQHELQVQVIVFVKPASISKTSSGKVRRQACKSSYLEGSLNMIGKSELFSSASPSLPVPTESASFIRRALDSVTEHSVRMSLLTLYLQEQSTRILRLSSAEPGLLESLTSLGLDSLMAVELAHELESALGILISPALLLNGASIQEVAVRILELRGEGAPFSLEVRDHADIPGGGNKLSRGQQALWLLSKMNPDSVAYNLSSAVQIQEEVNIAAMQQSFRKLIERHEQLRAIFPEEKGEPVCRYLEHDQLVLNVQRVQGWKAKEVEDYLDGEAHRPFHLEQEPLFRMHLLERDTSDYVLLFVVHHMIADFWSLTLLIDELTKLYAAACRNCEAVLPPIRCRYEDYVNEHEKELAGQSGDRMLNYWKKQLEGELPVLALPNARSRVSAQTFNGASEELVLDAGLSERLKRLGLKQDATMYMTVLAAFQVLLYRLSGQEDLIVGTPAAARSRADWGNVVGYFVNMLPLRTRMSPLMSFTELLSQVRFTVLHAFENQDYPFSTLVEALQPDRDASSSPLIQAAFAFQQTPRLDSGDLSSFALNKDGYGTVLNGLRLQSLELEQRGIPFDIMVMAAEHAGGFRMSMRYNRDLFESSTIKQFLSYFQTLLESIAGAPSQLISELEMLSSEERHTLIHVWNDTKSSIPLHQCAHELFEEIADRCPAEAAVVYGKTQLTYGELNRRANQLARYLRKRGIGPEQMVGICMHRSSEMIVGILAVLKAGGAYVPLDAALPEERMAYILEDAGVPVILTQSDLLNRLDKSGALKICLDAEESQFDQEPYHNLSSMASAENLAYMIYTSGTTGRPKGTLLVHRGLVNYLYWCKTAYPLETGGGAPVHSSISFDLTITSILAPLVTGRPIHIVSEAQDENSLGSMLAGKGGFSLVKLTPAHLEMLQYQLPAADLHGATRAFIIGGESLLAEKLVFWQEHVPDTLLINEYGPTECVVGCCTYQVGPEERRTGAVPIGRPIINTQVYILDSCLNPVPVGVAGELYIGGNGVARGYRNRPDITADRFIPDPFGSVPGGRLYKTGDLARYMPDGNMMYMGRLDRQVKLRGYRIELEEVEAALLSHPGVEQCVVNAPSAPAVLPVSNQIKYCAKCTIPSNYPGITFNSHGVCSMCTNYEYYKRQAQDYFRTLDDLKDLFKKAQTSPPSSSSGYDCMVLFSGGKDSTYMLYRLAEMGLKILAYTFDNGYLFEGALANIERVVQELGIDHVLDKSPYTNEILADSLRRHSNVCNFCFKTIYTLSTNMAHQKGIRFIVTGLSRGQIFETRLMNIFETNPDISIEKIDDTILEARKVYHRMEDSISTCLDTQLFQQDDIFQEIEFVDFYRFCDISQSGIYEYLRLHVPWRNPVGTGCTTNCLLNDAGIYVHTLEKGFHNYALPSSWEVRLEHESRAAALKDLGTPVDEAAAKRILQEIGYQPRTGQLPVPAEAEQILTAYYVSKQDLPIEGLRKFLAHKMPEYMVPGRYTRIDSIPLTGNGKVDYGKLPAAAGGARAGVQEFKPPATKVEAQLAQIWSQVIGIPAIGREDHFFVLGGHSLMAFQITALVRERFEVDISLKRFFEAPTLAFMAGEIEHLIKARQTGGSDRSIPVLSAAPAQKYEPFPLTDVQEAYWIGRREGYQLGNVAAHGYTEVDIQGLDVKRFELALRRLIERHDMLRAVVQPGGWQQILHEVPSYSIEVTDLRESGETAAAARMTQIRERMSHQVLPSGSWPLFEIQATLLQENKVRLHFSVDMLIGDAMSWQILAKELEELYADADAALPHITISFRDYVLAERKLRDSETYKRSVGYWDERLGNLRPGPELPLAMAPSLLIQPQFSRITRRLAPEVWHRLKYKASSAGITSSMLVATVFSEVLAAWSSVPSFTLNVTMFNRLALHEEVERLVGDFTSVTLLAVEPLAGEAFVDKARRLQAQMWENLDHRDVSGVHVLRKLAQRQGSMQLLPVVFTSLLHNEDAPKQTPSLLGLNLLGMGSKGEDTYSISQTPQVWLDHQVAEEQGELVMNWDAVTELFPAGMLEEMIEACCSRLSNLSSSDEAWSLAPEGWRMLLAPLSLPEEAKVYPEAARSEVLLHELFVERALDQPGKCALTTSDRQLTYGELYRYSVHIARLLQEGGAIPNHTVAVVMEKGWEQIAGVMGILMAGAAYLPVDPHLPEERISYMLSHGEVEQVLTQSWLAERLNGLSDVRTIIMDKLQVPDEDMMPFASVQRADDLAYVIFTSGSTGIPKGVMINHRGAVNTILDINRRFGISADDRLLALSSLSFDLSVYDIFGTLAAGGTIVLPDSGMAPNPEEWMEVLHRQNVTMLNSVPSLLEMLIKYAEGQHLRLPDALRLVMLSGDWIPVTLPDRIRAQGQDIRLNSLGGATEASIWSVEYPIGEVQPDWRSIPYGRALTHQSVCVLDESLNSRPTWVPGSLYIGGEGLAMGYWRDEEKTKASFLHHPVSGERLYRTGDRGRYLPDGNIEFLGREDNQVKIRGYRVETGEIEAMLNQHPEVSKSVVILAGKLSGDSRLIAYVVPSANTEGTDGSGKNHKSITEPVRGTHDVQNGRPVREEADAAKRILLIPPRHAEARRSNSQTTAKRRSFAGKVTMQQIGELLQTLHPVRLEGVPFPKYRYGSAGNLYPVQGYLMVKPGGIEGIEGGTYYYHPVEHELIRLPESECASYDGDCIADSSRNEQQPPLVIALVGNLAAAKPLYSMEARTYCVLEAGLITQLLKTAASDCQLRLCEADVTDIMEIETGLELPEGHIYLHSIAVDTICSPSEEEEKGRRLGISSESSGGGHPVSTGGKVHSELAAVLSQARQHPEVNTDTVFQISDQTVLDPLQRLEYKLSAPGIRRFEAGVTRVKLVGPELTGVRKLAYAIRRSYRQFNSGLLPLEAFSAMMAQLSTGQYERWIMPGVGRNSSDTDRYPVQIYATVRPDRIEGISGGTYYYHPEEHSLAKLSDHYEYDLQFHSATNRDIMNSGAFALFFVGEPEGIEVSHGNNAGDRALLEAGVISQLLEMRAPEYGIGLCQLGNVNFDAIRNELGMKKDLFYLHCVAGGGIAASQMTFESLYEDNEEVRYLADKLPQADSDIFSQPEKSADGINQDTSRFIRYLQTKLPEYMIPSAVVILEEIPLSSNGKVDRQALPDPVAEQGHTTGGAVLPQTEMEHLVSGVIKELLEVEQISAEASFFHLGLTSLHMVRAHVKLEQLLDRKISISDLFEYPSIRLLSRHLSQTRQDSGQVKEGQARSQLRKELLKQRADHKGGRRRT